MPYWSRGPALAAIDLWALSSTIDGRRARKPSGRLWRVAGGPEGQNTPGATEASLAVNSELIALHWRIGRDILDRQERDGWGGKVVQRLATDLRAEFPQMRGLSRANLLHMRAAAEAWPDPEIVQRVVG